LAAVIGGSVDGAGIGRAASAQLVEQKVDRPKRVGLMGAASLKVPPQKAHSRRAAIVILVGGCPAFGRAKKKPAGRVPGGLGSDCAGDEISSPKTEGMGD